MSVVRKIRIRKCLTSQDGSAIVNTSNATTSPRFTHQSLRKTPMLYNELRAALKTYREAGSTEISLNSNKDVLQAEYDRLTAETVTETEAVENDTPVLRDITELQAELDNYFELDMIVDDTTNLDKELYLPIISEIGEMLHGFALAIIVYGQLCQWLMRTTLKGIALGRAWYPMVQSACKVYGLRILAWYIDRAIEAYESGQAYKAWVMYYKRLAVNG